MLLSPVCPEQQYLGDSTSAVPNVPDIDLTAQTLPEGVTEEDVTNFTSIYREHCEVLLDAVVTLQFSSVEIIWQQFWRSANNSEDLLDDDPEKIMPKRVLHQLCDWPPVQDYVKTMDYLFYQNLVEVLIPDVLRAIPSKWSGLAATTGWAVIECWGGGGGLRKHAHYADQISFFNSCCCQL